MSDPRARYAALSLLLSLGLASGACSASGSPSGGAVVDSSSVPTLASSATAVAPSATAPMTASASIEPTPAPEQSVLEPSMPEPPAASIAVEGGDPVVAQLGTFTWMNGGSDAPWLDGSPIHVGAGETLILTLAEEFPIGPWYVRRVAPGSRDGMGAVAMGHGSGEPITFGAPPPGSWSVAVSVRFAVNDGSALYYWRIDVN